MGQASQSKVFPELSVKQEDAVKEEARNRCKEDLHYLAKEVLGYSRVTDHYHKDMAMDIDTPKYRFKLLLHPRGHFKSTIGTEARSIQKLVRNPNERILITNAKLDNSRKFLRAISHHWEYNVKFRWLWRNYWLTKYATAFHKAELGDKLDWIIRNTQDEFVLLRPYAGREASLTTGAVDSSLVSQHFSTIIADDLINREYVRTPEMVEKSILYFKDLLDLLDPEGALEIIGTRWSHYDLYQWIIETFGGRSSLRVPKGFVSEEIQESAENTPESRKDWMISVQPVRRPGGQPVFPEEFNDRVLNDLLEAKGPYEYGAQYELNPTAKENQKFEDSWFNLLDVYPKDSEISQMRICMTVDPAKSLQDGADNSAFAICGYDENNYMFFLDGLDERLSIAELPEAVFAYVRKWVNRGKLFYPVGFEAVGFQETYIHALERMMMESGFFFGIEPITHRKQSKEERILRLVPRVKNGFYIPRNLIKRPYSRRGAEYDLAQRLKFQLVNFPFAGKDDLADALADQLHLVEPISIPKKVIPLRGKQSEFVHSSIKEDAQRSRYTKHNLEGMDAVR